LLYLSPHCARDRAEREQEREIEKEREIKREREREEKERREREERERITERKRERSFPLFVNETLHKKRKITVKLVLTVINAIFSYIGHYSSENSDNQKNFLTKLENQTHLFSSVPFR
jgi:hypothetical protein